eukprot:6422601-Prymnesium_polylepis.1
MAYDAISSAAANDDDKELARSSQPEVDDVEAQMAAMLAKARMSKASSTTSIGSTAKSPSARATTPSAASSLRTSESK